MDQSQAKFPEPNTYITNGVVSKQSLDIQAVAHMSSCTSYR